MMRGSPVASVKVKLGMILVGLQNRSSVLVGLHEQEGWQSLLEHGISCRCLDQKEMHRRPDHRNTPTRKIFHKT